MRLFYFFILNTFFIVPSFSLIDTEFEKLLSNCCQLGLEKATSFLLPSFTLKVNSLDDVCFIKLDELKNLTSLYKHQCSSIIKVCCISELNKQTCKFSKKIILNYFQLEKKNFDTKNDRNYQLCLPDPILFEKNNFINSKNNLNTKLILFEGSLNIYSECCFACKLGLFAALYQLKCIIQKDLKSSKYFEESFYECCYSFKNKLLEIKNYDKLLIENLIYPNTKENSIYSNLSENITNTSSIEKPFNDEKTQNYYSNKILNKNYDSTTINVTRKEKKIDIKFNSTFNRISLLKPNCELNKNCISNYCEQNSNACSLNEECINLENGYKCLIKYNNNSISFKNINKNMEKFIDKCKIGNHNCNQTQICKSLENTFICINNNDLKNNYESFKATDEKSDINYNYENNENLCQKGFQYNNLTQSCEDLNECQLNTHNCPENYRCDNKIGSYVCVREQSCGTGYTFDLDKKICEDINECELNYHDCTHPYKCVNYEGSFRCELKKCDEGFRDINGKCDKVFCAPGYFFNSLSDKCLDVDECKTGIDSINSNFGDNFFWNQNSQTNSFSEFEKLSNGRFKPCKKDEVCVNKLGSYECQKLFSLRKELIDKNYNLKNKCLIGENFDYEKNECVDIDECINGLHKCDSIKNCINKKPGYSCNCLNGYYWNQLTKKCEDINECLKTDICSQKCINKIGSYECECYDGYILSKIDNKTCEYVSECSVISKNNFLSSLKSNKFCRYKCIKINNDYKCECPKGYIVNGTNCTDIDECKLNKNICKINNKDLKKNVFCVNTKGSYECIDIECPKGYIKNSKNNLRCEILDETKFNTLKPKYFSYFFISLQSNLMINFHSVRIASIRSATNFDLEFNFISSFSKDKFFDDKNLAKKDDFSLKRSQNDDIYLLNNLLGPQEINLEFVYRIIPKGKIINKLMVKIFISEYTF